MNNKNKKNWILFLIIAVLVLTPLLILKIGDFNGANDKVEKTIKETKPDYGIWFQSILKPKSGEMKTIFFAFEVAIGAGFIGYFIGLTKGKSKNTKGKNEVKEEVICPVCKQKFLK